MRKEGLSQNDKNQLDDNFIKHKLEEAFGYSEQQLVEEFDRAAALSAQHPDPRLKPPEDEFQKIMERVEKDKKAKRKVVRLKRILKPMLVAALLGGVILGSGIGVNGLEGVDYKLRERDDGDVLFSNAESITGQNNIEKAYNEVEEKLGIPVIELFYLPSDMIFEEMFLGEDRARLEFIYENNHFYFYQALWNLKDSANYISDRNLYKEVYNRYLNVYISIYKNELEGEKPEFGAQFVNEDAYYYLFGVIDEDEFLKIVEYIKYYEN